MLHCLLSANKSAAAIPLPSGDLPLHCFAFPIHDGNNGNSNDTRGLKQLIGAYPESLKIEGVGSRLPLHNMLERKWINGAKVMLESYPGASTHADAKGSLPIHVLCRYPPYHHDTILLLRQLVNANPSSLMKYDDRGYLPLHHASENMKDPFLFHELLESYTILPKTKGSVEALFLGCESLNELSVIYMLVHRSLDLFQGCNPTASADYGMDPSVVL